MRGRGAAADRINRDATAAERIHAEQQANLGAGSAKLRPDADFVPGSLWEAHSAGRTLLVERRRQGGASRPCASAERCSVMRSDSLWVGGGDRRAFRPAQRAAFKQFRPTEHPRAYSSSRRKRSGQLKSHGIGAPVTRFFRQRFAAYSASSARAIRSSRWSRFRWRCRCWRWPAS